MRILGIETTSPKGSVALVENGQVVLSLDNPLEHAHAEHALQLIERALATAGWAKSSLQRVGVGIGPGSFTGVRVGIALGEGIATGLGIAMVGVGSLRAMALGVSPDDTRVRVPLLDARRNELFAAGYDAAGQELWAPRVIPASAANATIEQAVGAGHVLLGVPAASLGLQPRFASELCDHPSAACVALAAERDEPTPDAVLPLYIRDADVALPNLPPSPLAGERS